MRACARQTTVVVWLTVRALGRRFVLKVPPAPLEVFLGEGALWLAAALCSIESIIVIKMTIIIDYRVYMHVLFVWTDSKSCMHRRIIHDIGCRGGRWDYYWHAYGLVALSRAGILISHKRV